MRKNLPRCDKPHRRKGRQVELVLPPPSIGKSCASCGENSTYCVHRRDHDIMLCENCYRKQHTSDIAKQKRWLWDHKEGAGCVICREHNPRCLDYHHVHPEKKKFSIGSVSTSIPNYAIQIEMRKCVVLCANCHRKVEVALKHAKKQGR